MQTQVCKKCEVEKGLEGNICRCGTYEQMRHAITLLTKKGG